MLENRIMPRKQYNHNDDGDMFKRASSKIGTCPDRNFNNECFKKEKNDTMLRALQTKDLADDNKKPGPNAGRASLKDLQASPPSLKPGDSNIWPVRKMKITPEGCGNPVCLALDKKPMRFSSLCHAYAYLKMYNRLDSMHFVQKGDCMDIIMGKSEKAVWVDSKKEGDLDCTACSKSKYCKNVVTLNIDLSNLLLGKSSAFGGKNYINKNNEDKRMSGVPVEFENMCHAMNFIKRKENVNQKTKLMGVYFGPLTDIIPTSDEKKCLWTEWFDTDAACNSDKDIEDFTTHQYYEQNRVSQTMSICQSENIMKYEVRGGTTSTNNLIHILQDEDYQSILNMNFTLDISHEEYRATCDNKKQGDNRVPAPYLYNSVKENGEIVYNDKCMDIQMRYCCDTIKTFRPMHVIEWDRLIQFRFPIGGFIPTNIQLDTEGFLRMGDNSFRISIVSAVGDNCVKTLIFNLKTTTVEEIFDDDFKVEVAENSRFATIEKGICISASGDQPKEFAGYVRMNKRPDGTLMVSVVIKVNDHRIATLELTISALTEVESSLVTDIEDLAISSLIRSMETQTFTYVENTQVAKTDERFQSDLKFVDTEKTESGFMFTTTTVVFTSTQEKIRTINLEVNKFCEFDSSTIDVKTTVIHKEHIEHIDVYERTTSFIELLLELKKEILFSYLIESPPTEELFSECEWMDWISLDYPERVKEGEHELKHLAYDGEYEKHVCGQEPRNSLFIDVATRETLKPWYEMMYMVENQPRPTEHYKITPYYGYACSDLNGLQPKSCKDMKVRYCCAKERISSWTPWEDWGACTVSCGFGKQIRKREVKKCDSCKPMLEADDERFTTDSRACNKQDCPVDYTWTPWTAWSECTVSCNSGVKERHRECLPAKGGGRNCPNKNKNPDLYHEVEKCTMTDCDTFEYSDWSSWSQCSASCGQGQKVKKRTCRSQTTRQNVKDSFCLHYSGKMTDLFEQSINCLLQECPVNGGWSDWTEYTACTQDCRTEGSITVANRKRFQYCTNPMAKGGGKKCELLEETFPTNSITFDSETKAKVEIAPCSSDLPLCPEDCVFTVWSQWSACSASCIDRGTPLVWTANDMTEVTEFDEPLETMYTYFKEVIDSDNFPHKTRYRTKIAEAKNGGKCEVQTAATCLKIKDNDGNDIELLSQKEPCDLWEKHDNRNGTAEQDVVKYPEHTFDNSSHILGFCPIDCKWCQWTSTRDCKAVQEEMLKEEDNSCWTPEILEYLKNYDTQKGMKQTFEAIKDKLLELVKDPTTIMVDELDYEYSELPKLNDKCLTKKGHRSCRKSRKKAEYRKVLKAWRKDLETLVELTLKVDERKAKLPNLDGLFGGEACKMENGQTLTKYLVEDEEKAQQYFETRTKRDGCPVNMCDIPFNPNKIEPPPIPTVSYPWCKNGRWSQWSSYGKCTACGQKDRVKKRTRECVASCKGVKHTVPCPSYTDRFNREISNEQRDVCTPCPPEFYSSWSHWGDWELLSKTCGETFMQKRERKCMKNGKEAGAECLKEHVWFPWTPKPNDTIAVHVQFNSVPKQDCPDPNSTSPGATKPNGEGDGNGKPSLVGPKNQGKPSLVGPKNQGKPSLVGPKNQGRPSLVGNDRPGRPSLVGSRR